MFGPLVEAIDKYYRYYRELTPRKTDISGPEVRRKLEPYWAAIVAAEQQLIRDVLAGKVKPEDD